MLCVGGALALGTRPLCQLLVRSFFLRAWPEGLGFQEPLKRTRVGHLVRAKWLIRLPDDHLGSVVVTFSE